MPTRRGFEQICGQGLDSRALRAAVLDALRVSVPFDAYAWLLTDPVTSVGCDPLAETPSLADLPALIRSKYLTVTNRWTTLPSNTAVTLMTSTEGALDRSLMWRELLSKYGVDDVASIAFRDRHGCWGFLDLWRMGGRFTADDCAALDAMADVVTPALRRCAAAAFDHVPSDRFGTIEPAVLLLSDDIQMLAQTPQTDAYLRALLPTAGGRSPVPAAAYNVAAQLLAREHGIDQNPPWARVHLRDGIWMTLLASRLEQTASGAGASIAVSIELTKPTDRAALFALVTGLSKRETDVVQHLIGGATTRELAAQLFVSEHTVQDHLKAIFAKSGVNSRRTLIARATGSA